MEEFGGTSEVEEAKTFKEEPVVPDEAAAADDDESFDLESRRREELFTKMNGLEQEFTAMKASFYAEKIDALKKEQESLRNETHPGFLKKCKELEEYRDHRLWATEKWKELQLQNIQAIYDAEVKQTADEHKAEVSALKERMIAQTVENRRKLQDEKNTFSLSGDVSRDERERVMTRTLRKRGAGGKEGKPSSTAEHQPFKRRLNPPHINYTLKETEISDDLALIQKAVTSHPTAFGKYAAERAGTSKSNGGASNVYTDRGRLVFHGQVFEKGKDVFIEAKHESGRWHGVIVVVNPAEIHIRSMDGTKSRFSLAQLRNGKYTIMAVDTV